MALKISNPFRRESVTVPKNDGGSKEAAVVTDNKNPDAIDATGGDGPLMLNNKYPENLSVRAESDQGSNLVADNDEASDVDESAEVGVEESLGGGQPSDPSGTADPVVGGLVPGGGILSAAREAGSGNATGIHDIHMNQGGAIVTDNNDPDAIEAPGGERPDGFMVWNGETVSHGVADAGTAEAAALLPGRLEFPNVAGDEALMKDGSDNITLENYVRDAGGPGDAGPDGERLYLPRQGEGSLTLIDTSTGEVEWADEASAEESGGHGGPGANLIDTSTGEIVWENEATQGGGVVADQDIWATDRLESGERDGRPGGDETNVDVYGGNSGSPVVEFESQTRPHADGVTLPDKADVDGDSLLTGSVTEYGFKSTSSMDDKPEADSLKFETEVTDYRESDFNQFNPKEVSVDRLRPDSDPGIKFELSGGTGDADMVRGGDLRSKWEPGELDASKNEVSIETIEIAHEGRRAIALDTWEHGVHDGPSTLLAAGAGDDDATESISLNFEEIKGFQSGPLHEGDDVDGIDADIEVPD